MDKTGTLTQNKLKFQEVLPVGKFNLSESKAILGTWAHKATDQNPTSIAIKKECGSYDGPIVDEIPFNSKTSTVLFPSKQKTTEDLIFS